MYPAQRQVVDKRVWRELTAFFPAAVPFRVDSPECLECRGESANERRAEEAVRRQREQEIALPVLKALYGRKSGVSEACEGCAKANFGDCRCRAARRPWLLVGNVPFLSHHLWCSVVF